MGSLNDFHTRKLSSEGCRLDLTLPDGTKSDDYLIIRGIDSDEFKAANAKAARTMLVAADLSEAERFEQARTANATLLASLIAAWSFDEELTVERATEWLIEAPQVAEAIDRLASNRRLFLKKKSMS